MFWIVASILLGLVFWGGVYTFLKAKHRDLPEDVRFLKIIGGSVAGLALFLWLTVTAFQSLHNVGEREVAIVYNFSGTISGKRDPGVVFTAPWEHVKKENVGILNDEWNFGADNSAASIDQQKVFANLAVNYQIDSERILDLYRRVGPSWKTIIIDARVPQVFKETTASFTTPEVVQKREELRSRTRERLQQELDPYNIRVIDVFVTNLGFSESYSNAIEAKQKQVQDSARAREKVQEIKAVADQAFEQAAGEARANVERAKGEAQANRLRRQTLTPLLVQQSAIDKLNPNVQTIICPPGSVCIPNSPILPAAGGSGG